MSNGFNWKRDGAGWVGAIAAAAIAYLGFVTFDPLIENLEIKDENRVLRDQRDDLTTQIDQQKREQAQAKSDLVIAMRQSEAAKEEREDARQQRDKMTDAVTQITANVSDLIARERVIQDKLEALQVQADKRAAVNAGLREENSRLTVAGQQATAALKETARERDRIAAELKNARLLARRFILNQISTKLRASVPSIENPENAPDWPLIYWGDVGVQKFSALFAPDAKSHSDEWDSGPWGIGATYIFAPPEVSGPARNLVTSLFNDQMFGALDEVQRIQLQNEIIEFMKLNDAVFSAEIGFDAAKKRDLDVSWAIISNIKGSKFFRGCPR